MTDPSSQTLKWTARHELHYIFKGLVILACVSCVTGMQLTKFCTCMMTQWRMILNAHRWCSYSASCVETWIMSKTLQKAKYRKYFVKACFSIFHDGYYNCNNNDNRLFRAQRYCKACIVRYICEPIPWYY